jgi:small multidrug resistance pump
VAIKHSDGFSRFQRSLIVFIGYALAFFLMSILLRTLPIDITYAIWAGAGIIMVNLGTEAAPH